MKNPFAAIQAPAARDLWLAGLGVNVVRWLEILVFGLLALQLTGSPFWVAVMTFARMLPLLSGAVLTSLVRSIPKRSVLVAVFTLLTATAATLWLIAALGRLELWHLVVAALLAGFAWTLEVPIRRTALAEAVGLERVQGSMGLEVVSNQITRIIGPALGGLLLDTVGPTGIFALGAIAQGTGLWLVWRMVEPAPLTPPGPAVGLAQSIAEGFAYVRRHRLLMGTVMVTLVFNFWGFPYVAIAPVIGESILGLTPTGIGLLAAVDAVGALIAAFIIIDRGRPDRFALIYSLGATLFMVCTLTFGFATTVPVATMALFIAGFGLAGFNAMQISLPIAATRPTMRVRAMGMVTVAIGAAPFGFLHAGLMAEWLGAPWAQRLIASEGLIAMALVCWRWPELLRREAPRPLAE